MILKIVATALLFSPLGVSAQLMKALEKRYMEPFMWADIEISMTNEEKFAELSKLPEGDTIQFTDYYDDGLYPLDTVDLHYLDLDTDGDIDLIYHALTGNMQRIGSKVYIQEQGHYIFKGTMTGRIQQLKLEPQLEIFTYEAPCCDSYTNSIRTYTLDNTITCTSNVVFIGLKYGGMRGFPDLQSNDMRILSSSSLFISPIDLRVGYFRERTKEIHAKLRAGEFVMCATIPDGTKVNILDSTTVKGEKWHLIITESLLKPDSSLYENWQTRHIPKSRYLGWTNGIGLINRQ